MTFINDFGKFDLSIIVELDILKLFYTQILFLQQ
jgi:hypothetical protein